MDIEPGVFMVIPRLIFVSHSNGVPYSSSLKYFAQQPTPSVCKHWRVKFSVYPKTAGTALAAAVPASCPSGPTNVPQPCLGWRLCLCGPFHLWLVWWDF